MSYNFISVQIKIFKLVSIIFKSYYENLSVIIHISEATYFVEKSMNFIIINCMLKYTYQIMTDKITVYSANFIQQVKFKILNKTKMQK